MLSDYVNKNENIIMYTKDTQGIAVSLNESLIQSFGLASASDYLGRTDMDLPDQELYAPAWIENDRRIMTTRTAETIFEVCGCVDKIQWFRSYKAPLYGHQGNVIGVTAMSIKISDASRIPLTRQQTACLKELAFGFTHKQIAKNLGLSQKTVEHYLDAVKNKLQCKTRSELIMQAIERGLLCNCLIVL
jgi:DNA-binding CsgD family transcriptional regulator